MLSFASIVPSTADLRLCSSCRVLPTRLATANHVTITLLSVVAASLKEHGTLQIQRDHEDHW